MYIGRCIQITGYTFCTDHLPSNTALLCPSHYGLHSHMTLSFFPSSPLSYSPSGDESSFAVAPPVHSGETTIYKLFIHYMSTQVYLTNKHSTHTIHGPTYVYVCTCICAQVCITRQMQHIVGRAFTSCCSHICCRGPTAYV